MSHFLSQYGSNLPLQLTSQKPPFYEKVIQEHIAHNDKYLINGGDTVENLNKVGGVESGGGGGLIMN